MRRDKREILEAFLCSTVFRAPTHRSHGVRVVIVVDLPKGGQDHVAGARQFRQVSQGCFIEEYAVTNTGIALAQEGNRQQKKREKKKKLP